MLAGQVSGIISSRLRHPEDAGSNPAPAIKLSNKIILIEILILTYDTQTLIMKIFLTGRPGIGKSTVFKRIIDELKQRGLKVGGIVTPEIRENGKRIGFEVIDLFSGKRGILATVKYKTKIRFGKYFIDLESFEKIAIPALNFASENCEVIGIDEIGKMEFFSERFKQKLEEILESEKIVIAVLHRNFVERFKRYGKVIEVTLENRENLPKEIISLI